MTQMEKLVLLSLLNQLSIGIEIKFKSCPAVAMYVKYCTLRITLECRGRFHVQDAQLGQIIFLFTSCLCYRISLFFQVGYISAIHIFGYLRTKYLLLQNAVPCRCMHFTKQLALGENNCIPSYS